MNKLGVLCAFGLALTVSAPAHALEFITNGTFTSGLTSWTSYTTTNGTVTPTATTFNVTGAGTSAAVQMRAGQVSFQGFGSTPRGGGLYQNVNLTYSGLYTFSANYATTAPGNLSGGVFALLINDVVVTSFDTADVAGTERGTLNYQTNLAPGLYKIGIQVTRPFVSTASSNQYFDNVSLSAPIPAGYVPEPATWLMMIAGLGATGAMMRRGRMQARVRFG